MSLQAVGLSHGTSGSYFHQLSWNCEFVFKTNILIGCFREVWAELSLSRSSFLSLKTCLEEISSQIEIFRKEKRHYKSFLVTLFNARALWIFLPHLYVENNVKWKMNKLSFKNCVILKAEVFPEVWVKLFWGRFSLRQEMQVFQWNCFHGGFLPNLPGGDCALHSRDAQQLLWESWGCWRWCTADQGGATQQKV